jgi:hypothetical protein
MKYQDCSAAAQALDEAAINSSERAVRLSLANISPHTGLATDYLNHFNEAAMLLEMLPSSPDCLDDLLVWKPISYREHFASSRFRGRDLAIAAYEAADPNLRGELDALASAMTAMLEATQVALRSGMPPETAALVVEAAAAWLKPLIARAGSIINGDADRASGPTNSQAMIDGLLDR